jgi:hypothetical protein
MNLVETTRIWFWRRIWSSIKWVFLWIILIIVSIILLWRNEWRTIKTTISLDEWQKITVNWKTSPIDSTLEWKIIYIFWKADTKDILRDDTFNIEANAIKLSRDVSMYQWQEEQNTQTQDNMWWSQTQTTTYNYKMVWNNDKIDSSQFKEAWHINPSNWPFDSKQFVASDVKVWDMKLSSTFVGKMNNEEKISLDWKQNDITTAVKNIQNIKINNNILYIWKGTEENPQIWDIQISFSAVYPSEISAIWQQQSNQLIWYTTTNGKNIALLNYWTVSMPQMYINAHNENRTIAWLLRWLWLLLIFFWFSMILWFVATLASVVPLLGRIVGFWVSLISFVLSIILWFTVILVAWFAVRPTISMILLGSIVVVITSILLFKKTSKKNNDVVQITNTPIQSSSIQNNTPVQNNVNVPVQNPPVW